MHFIHDLLSSFLTAPLFCFWLAQEEFNKVEKELEMGLVKGLAKATEIHSIGGRHIGKVTKIEKNNTKALKSMTPEHFEDLLHPVFKEDEWKLFAIGGAMGAAVGLVQALTLGRAMGG